MKKQLCYIFIIFLAFAVHAQNNSKSSTLPSPYEADILKAFADSLYEEGFLSQAEGEYKRFLFSQTDKSQDNQNLQSSLLALTNIYKKQKNTNGINWLKQNFYDNAAISVKEKICYTQAAFIFKTRSKQDFSLFSTSFEQNKNDFTIDFTNLINTSTLLLNNDIEDLKNHCARLSATNPDYEQLNTLLLNYKTKSPGLALFLSTIIPGCGKWYTGSFGAFLSSFLTIGSFIAGTVITGIQTGWKSWQPYVFGTCGLVLYTSELYGAYQSAKRYNDAQFRALCNETDKLYEKEY